MRSHALHHFIFFTHSFCFSAGLTNNEFVRRDLWAKAWMWAHSAVLFDTHGNFCSSSLFELDTSDGSVWCVCCTPIACLVSPFLFCHYSVQAIYRYKIERSLYDIISISDFHRMNMIKRTADAYVKPLFATGYSLGITCLRLWRDFFLFFGFRCAVCVCVWMNTTVCNECVARLAMKFIFFFFFQFYNCSCTFTIAATAAARVYSPNQIAIAKNCFPLLCTLEYFSVLCSQ